MADRVAVLPVHLRQRLVDDGDGCRVGAIGRVEPSARDEVLAESFEGTIGRDLPVAFHVHTGRRHEALHREAPVADRVRQRQRPHGTGGARRRERRGRDSSGRRRTAPPSRSCRKVGSGSATRIVSTPAGSKPRRTCCSAHRLRSTEARDDEQHDGQRHLGDHQRVAQALAAGARRGVLRAILQRLGEARRSRVATPAALRRRAP